MTTLTGIELSEKVAELYGIDAKEIYGDLHCGLTVYWLHEDSARVFELAHEYQISIFIRNGYGFVSTGQKIVEIEENSIQAYRTAILQTLVVMKE